MFTVSILFYSILQCTSSYQSQTKLTTKGLAPKSTFMYNGDTLGEEKDYVGGGWAKVNCTVYMESFKVI